MNPLKKNRISRRHLLRGAAVGSGTAIMLPALEAMFATDKAFAQDAAGKPRFVAIYQPNGHHKDQYHPSGSLRDLDFSGQKSAPLEAVMSQSTLMRNFAGCHTGGQGNGHLRGITSWLPGASVPTDDETTHSVSIDTVIAEHYMETAPTGRNQHLVLSGSPFLDPGRMAYNNEQKDWISTARNGEKIFAEIDIESVFNRVMMGIDENSQTADPAEVARQQARLAMRQSALDFVGDGITSLEQRLGVTDRAAVDNYLTNIRSIETRLSEAPGDQGAPQCQNPGVEFARKWPSERKADEANPYIDEHWQDTMRVLQVAFQCEAVRSVAYMLETEAGESGYRNHGLPNSHGAAHSVNQAYADRDGVHAELLREMIELFGETQVGGGQSLLDQTMILFGMGNGVNHTANQITAVLSGFRGTGNLIPQINHGALHEFNNDVNQHNLMRTILLHFDAWDPNEAFGDAGPNGLIDLTA